VLIRSWNVFHGNSDPPERRAFLEQMVRLATGDGPDVVCLQEVPLWALERLPGWSRMQAAVERAAPARVGPLPSSAGLGRVLTEAHHGLIRSAFTGQGNAILVAPRLRLLARDRIVLNAKRYRDTCARELGLGALARLAWARERRVCQAVRVGDQNGRTVVVANVHATSYPADPRLAEAEVRRAAVFAEAVARPGETLVLAGDYNVRAGSPALAELAAWGFAGGGNGVDHLLARDAAAGVVHVWPDRRRRLDGRLLSDHAPLEVTIE
jgi:endonuclease/exonuclease/phosphatase family metal-dependent hydrolase